MWTMHKLVLGKDDLERATGEKYSNERTVDYRTFFACSAVDTPNPTATGIYETWHARNLIINIDSQFFYVK
jgi:hypothetical protein